MSEQKPAPAEWQHANWVSQLGKWAWLWGLIVGIIYAIWGIGIIGVSSVALIIVPYGFYGLGTGIWYLICGIIAIFVSFAIIKPKVSNKCIQKDWDHFHNWVWKLGNFRFPFVLFWGIILEMFGLGWAGLPVIIVAIMTIFIGPKPYQWTE